MDQEKSKAAKPKKDTIKAVRGKRARIVKQNKIVKK